MATFKSKYTGTKIEELLDKMEDITKFDIKDIYPTLAELQAAFPTGNEYAYQITADENVYIWSTTNGAWESLGQLKGEKGADGATGADGKTAYQSAIDGGYTGTEAEFNTILATAQSQITTLNTSLSPNNFGINCDFRKGCVVNTRGLSIYNTAWAYSIDMWRISDACTLTLIDDGIQITTGKYIYTLFENGDKYLNQDITVSVSVNGTIYKGTNKIISADSAVTFISNSDVSFAITYESSSKYLKIYFQNIGTSANIFNRCKFELGEISTLVNDPPMDYGKELAVCQRYCRTWNAFSRIRAVSITVNSFDFFLPFENMRISPTMSGTENILLQPFSSGSSTVSGFTYTIQSFDSHGVYIRATKTAHGLADAYIYPAVSTKVLFSADL